MMRQDRLQALAPRLSAQGFKILLDIAATARGSLRVLELPYTFGTRLRGESKLSSIVALDFLGLFVAKLSGDLIPVRFSCSRSSARWGWACTWRRFMLGSKPFPCRSHRRKGSRRWLP